MTLPLTPWTRCGIIIPQSQTYEGGITAEPSVVIDGAAWQAWYTTLGGVGYATATSPYAWTKLRAYDELVDSDFSALTLTDASFETDGGSGLASGWNEIHSTAGEPTYSLIAGRTGGFAQRIQYTAHAGDTGKQILLYQEAVGAVATGDTVRGTVYVKAATFTHATAYILIRDDVTGMTYQADVAPTSSWAQYETRHKWFYPASGFGPVQLRPITITLTADSAVIDVTLDDAALGHSAVPTNPVEDDGQCSSVTLVNGTYHMYYITQSSSAAILHRTSSDGIIWSDPDTALVAGAGGSWEISVWNTSLWEGEPGLWYLFYEGFNGAGAGAIGYAWSHDPAGPWTKNPNNPVVSGAKPTFSPVPSMGGPNVVTYGGVNYMFFHGPTAANAGTDIYRASGSADSWTLDQTSPVVARHDADEGPPPATGQVADPCWVTDGTDEYLFASTNYTSGQPTFEVVKLFTAPLVTLSRTVTLSDIRDEVDNRLSNFKFWVTWRATGDGITTGYTLPNGTLVLSSDSATVDGNTVTYTIDDQAAVIVFDVAPPSGSAIQVRYQWETYADWEIDEAINAGVRYLHDRFPVNDMDASLTGDGTTTEFPLTDDVDFLLRVETYTAGISSGAPSQFYVPSPIEYIATPARWVPTRVPWDTYQLGSIKYLRLYAPPPAGMPIRIMYIKRPTTLAADDDDLYSNGILEQSRDALVYYCMWSLLQKTIAPRMSDNAYLNADGLTNLRAIDVLRYAGNFQSLCEAHAERDSRSPRMRRL